MWVKGWECVWERKRERSCLILCTSGFTSICVCMCMGDPSWELPVLPPSAVFAEACRRCFGQAEVNKGVQASLLFLIGSQAEALALPIKPITHSQLTPDSLSAYMARRMRANRQKQRRWGGLRYWQGLVRDGVSERGRETEREGGVSKAV